MYDGTRRVTIARHRHRRVTFAHTQTMPRYAHTTPLSNHAHLSHAAGARRPSNARSAPTNRRARTQREGGTDGATGQRTVRSPVTTIRRTTHINSRTHLHFQHREQSLSLASQRVHTRVRVVERELQHTQRRSQLGVVCVCGE
jgi:hypothetical protein